MNYNLLIARDGRDKFLRKVVEELNELAAAISHYQDDKINVSEIIEEHADVMLQLEKLEWLISHEREHYHGSVYNSYLVKKRQLMDDIETKE